MQLQNSRIRRLFMPATIICLALAVFWTGCQPGREDPAALDVEETDDINYGDETSLLNATFRIDILDLQATLTYHPPTASVDGLSVIRFVMRPGQSRPLVHFNPALSSPVIDFLQLDDTIWADPGDGLRVVHFDGSAQQALEIQQDIDDGGEHLLTIGYHLQYPPGYPMFITQVNDIQGAGNEWIFPTINTPHELARHRLTLQVDSVVPYRCLGSGLVQSQANPDLQEWTLDSEREVASYTVMFALVPEADTLFEERIIAGIPVRIAAFVGGASIAAAFSELETWLPQLVADIAAFPMPRGLSIFLTNRGGGMEYYGATITSLASLSHEVVHMYFGCSAIARTYRDSWWDEAVVSWYDRSYPDYLTPIPAGYRSNMVSGRSPIAIGFDTRAYYQGTQIMETLALRLGGRAALVGFLSHLHETRPFGPFGTMELAGYFRDYSGIDIDGDFHEWLFRGAAPAAAPGVSAEAMVDLTPPAGILERYGLKRD